MHLTFTFSAVVWIGTDVLIVEQSKQRVVNMLFCLLFFFSHKCHSVYGLSTKDIALCSTVWVYCDKCSDVLVCMGVQGSANCLIKI